MYTMNRYNYQYCATARCKVQFGALDRWQHVSYVWKGYQLIVDGVDGVYNDFLLYNNGDPVCYHATLTLAASRSLSP